MDADLKRLLRRLADEHEKASFLEGDPSFFLRRAGGDADREAGAFVAASLSFGARSQFIPKIQWIFERAEGKPDRWIRTGAFERDFPADDGRCFYRFFSYGAMNAFFRAYRALMERCGTLGEYVRAESGGDCLKAVGAICRAFGEGAGGLVPRDAKSACKRVCMFLRWMVRDGSPVDLGLWAGFMDRRTLVIPLDTHVLQEARRLGLLDGTCASMCAARRLTAALAEAFPDDPCRGDFALFGLGVSRQEHRSREALAEELFRSGMNCSQSVFCAYADALGLDRSLAAKVSCGLGGGVGRMREVCGTVTGAALVLGMRHGEDKSVVYPLVQEFCRRFKEENGSVVCRELLAGTGATTGGAPEARTEGYYRKRPCVELVKCAVRILEEMAR